MKTPNDHLFLEEEYDIFWIDATRDGARGRAAGGLVVGARKDLQMVELEKTQRWIFLKSDKFQFIVCVLYISPSTDIEVSLDMIGENITEYVERFPDYLCVVGGDFNARVGADETADPLEEILQESCLLFPRKSQDIVANSRGHYLSDFMLSKGFTLLNGRTRGDCPAQFTFCSGSGCSVIDLFWVNNSCLELIENLEVMNTICSSDHFPIIVTIHNHVTVEGSTGCSKECAQSANYTKLVWKSENWEKYCTNLSEVEENFVNVESFTGSEQYELLVSAITGAACRSDMLVKKRSYNVLRSDKEWYDAECRNLKKETTNALKRCKLSGFILIILIYTYTIFYFISKENYRQH